MDSTYDTTYYATNSASNEAAGAVIAVVFGVMAIFYLALIVVLIVSLWRLFKKAGKPGWAAIVPIYNQVVMLEIAGRPVWWLLIILLVPFFGIWTQIVAYIDFAKSYGKSTGFGVLVALVPFIGLPILAFGKSTYVGPAAEGFDGFVPAPDRLVAPAPVVTQAPTDQQ